MMEYPKINSLYKRKGCGEFDEKLGRYKSDLEKKPRKSPMIEGEYACEEFASINRWTVTEKIDGTNVRIIMDKREKIGEIPIPCRIRFGGRTDDAQMPLFLLENLQDTFDYDKLDKVFPESNFVVLFGEGYGEKIQSGDYYRKGQGFILFDVFCSGWWLNRDAVKDVANQLSIPYVPLLSPPLKSSTSFWTTEEIVSFVKSKPKSELAAVWRHEMEGVVARSEPLMSYRKGGPIMFKLKVKDFD